MKQNLPIGQLLWCALVFVAAFLPWATVQGSPALSIGGFPMGNMSISMPLTLTGWNGSLTMAHIQFPNWLVIAAALGIAIVATLRAAGYQQAPRAVEWVLAIYGALYMLAFLAFMLNTNATLGIGCILTLVAFIGLIIALAGQHRALRPAEQPVIGNPPAA
ncbi:MAG TPA: hypothetical protein VFW40_01620 [Capsulimonadaceae bacterium]|nr:hypothetical protein [Capsulimonadaceae bacterium]